MAEPTLSVIIPVYNEAATIGTLLDRVAAVALPGVRKELVVVNDGSTDDSRRLIDEWAVAHPLPDGDRLVTFDKPNGGKGSAVRAGIERSTGEVVIVQDADLEYDPNDYRQCIEPILAGRAKVVYGSRERFTANRSHSSWAFYMGGLSVTYWFNLLYGASLTDEPTCYKTFDGPLIRALLFEGDHFEWEPELTGKLLRLGFEIHEAPISYRPRRVAEGKKISWRDGVEALWVGLCWRVRPLGRVRERLAALPDERPRLEARRRRLAVLWGILALGLAVRVLVALPGLATPGFFERMSTLDNLHPFARPDTPTYVLPALALLEDGRFLDAPGGAAPATIRPPGYSLLLAAIWAVTGRSWQAAVLAGCLIGALTAIAVFKAGERLGGLGVGAIAALLYSLNMTAIAAAPLVLSDTLFVFVAAWQFFFFVRFYRTERLLDLWFSVGLAALACLVRPSNLPWIVPALFLILIFTRKSWRKRALGAAGALVVFALVLSPWMLRNRAVGAGFRLDTNMGNTLLYHNVPALLSKVTPDSAETWRSGFQRECEELFRAEPERFATPASQVEYKVERAKGFIRQHPWLYARLHIQPFILLPDPALLELLGWTQGGRGTLNVFHTQGVVAAIRHYLGGQFGVLVPLLPLGVAIGLAYLGCAFQLLRWIAARQVYLFFLFMGFVPFYLVLPGPIVMPRYHLPALPLICVMAGLALCWLWQRRQRRRATSV